MDRALGRFWPRAESKLYEEPKKLVEHGFAAATTEHVGKRPRTVYAITGEGRAALATWHQTNGDAGEAVDMPEPQRLLDLAKAWDGAAPEERARIWHQMLSIHADQVYGIGILAGAPQPIVVSRKLRNVPDTAIWAWEPGAQFGILRPDEFFFAPEAGQ